MSEQPTIYSILPMLENEIISLMKQFMGEDGGAMYDWELAIFNPGVNAFLHYMAGVNDSLKCDNYISTLANVRGLIETLGAIVYDGTQKLPKDAYSWMFENERIPKRNKRDTKWIGMRPTEFVAYAQNAVDQRVNLKEIYDSCCDIMHLTTKHVPFLGGFNPKLDEESRIVKFKIGSKDNIPVEVQKEIIDFCTLLTNSLGGCIRSAIKEKGQRHTPYKGSKVV